MAQRSDWDMALRTANASGTMEVTIPKPIARSLLAKGYERVKVMITDDGILLVPYVGESKHEAAEIPDW